MMKKSLIESVGGFGSYTWDVKFFFDSIFSNPINVIKFINKILYFKRDNLSGASWNRKKFWTDVKNNRIYAVRKYKLPKYFYVKIYFEYFKFRIIFFGRNIAKRLHVYEIIHPYWILIIDFISGKKK